MVSATWLFESPRHDVIRFFISGVTYRVIQRERPIFWELIIPVVVRKKLA